MANNTISRARYDDMAVKHRIRVDGNSETKVVILTARRAIIEYCKECVGFDRNEVRHCTSVLCPLYPFRTHDTPKDTLGIAT